MQYQIADYNNGIRNHCSLRIKMLVRDTLTVKTDVQYYLNKQEGNGIKIIVKL